MGCENRHVSSTGKRRNMIKQITGVAPKGSHKQTEHELQVRCMTWLKYEYPDLDKVTFAVPNGGMRNTGTAKAMKAEGEKAGVADIIVLKSNCTYTALCIEMKTENGKQSEKQKLWQKAIEDLGESKYVICRSLEQFKQIIYEYMQG